ncbi:amino acid transporter [Xylariomycetidae sp. FL2044]|nr:amino acid transporter [Xylariomycetidae sp. FL2044]
MHTDQPSTDDGTIPPEEQRLLDNSAPASLHRSPSASVAPHTDASSDHAPPPPRRTLTFLNGLAIVIGIQIGSGIFSAPASVVSAVGGRRSSAVAAWLLAGILAWTGAISFVELGRLVPVNGGMQEYLVFLYGGEELGFVFAWSWILISRPCGLAMVSLIFAEYLFKAVAGGDETAAGASLKGTAVSGIVLVTLLNCLGSRVGNGMAKAFMAVKIAGLLSIALSGWAYWISVPGAMGPSSENAEIARRVPDIWANLDAFTNAVLAAVFAYGGWESISFVAGEIQDVGSILPRILHTSMTLVIILFISSNLALYTIVPASSMAESNAVAVDFGERVFGIVGRLFYTWVVCLSCLGTLNAIIFSAGRLTQAAGSRRFVPGLLNHNATPPLSKLAPHLPGRLRQSVEPHTPQNIPVNAMLFNAAVGCGFALIGSFRQLLIFKGMMEYSLYLIIIFGLLVRNIRHQLWSLAIGAPALFCIMAIVVILRAAISHVIIAISIAVFFILLSLIYRIIWSRWKRSHHQIVSDVS